MLCSVASALRLIDRPRLASPSNAVTRRAALLSALASVHSARAADSEATEEMVASSTERWSRFFVDTVPRGPAASAPDVVLAATRACYRECFSKFGDSLLPGTEKDVGVYCTSRCFLPVATRTLGLRKGSANFCDAYNKATDLEYYDCDS